jgi:hypothetical protein
VAYAVPFALYSLLQIVRRNQPHWAHYLLIALVASTLALLLPAYQWAVTGDPWLNPYLLWWPYDRIGFGPGIGAMPGGHSPYYAWINLKQDLSRAATDVLGWPAMSWLPLLLGLGLRPRRRIDWALLAPFACLVVAYLFYWIGSPARLWGPRYYFEGFGGLWILAALGLCKAWGWARVRGAAATLEAPIPPKPVLSGSISGKHRGRWLRPAFLAILLSMVTFNLAYHLPNRLQEAHGFYGISREQLRPIREAGLENALVIVYAERWLEYGALLAGMSPTLDDPVVYARGGGDAADAAVISQFPGRSVYYLVRGELFTDHLLPKE